MNDTDAPVVPVWTLCTTDAATLAPVAAAADDGALTPERLTELRAALAALSPAPVMTLEAHPLARRRSGSAGLPLAAASPLAQELSRLVAGHAQRVPAVAKVAQSREVLYRMVVPAKVVAQMGKGLVQPMKSNAVAGGIYGDLVGAKGIAAKAAFVPAATAPMGAATGAAAGTVAAGRMVTVAAPLMLLAVAVGASAHADRQRQQALGHIAELLEQLHDDKLERERNELDGCRDAIDKATALVLDRGRLGASLGLDSAVHAISTATQIATGRVQRWEAALDSFARDRVDLSELEAAFPGVCEDGGRFRAHLELATLAIALKRRVVLLQAVEAGQSDPDSQFASFVRSLDDDQRRVLDLESRIDDVLRRLSALEVRPPRRLIDQVMTRKQVDNLLEASYRLRSVGVGVGVGVGAVGSSREVVVEIERHSDGTLLALPTRPV